MTPQEWLIKEYQRKEKLLKQLTTQDEEYVFPKELSLILESVNMQPFMVLKEDHVCASVCEYVDV